MLVFRRYVSLYERIKERKRREGLGEGGWGGAVSRVGLGWDRHACWRKGTGERGWTFCEGGRAGGLTLRLSPFPCLLQFLNQNHYKPTATIRSRSPSLFHLHPLPHPHPQQLRLQDGEQVSAPLLSLVYLLVLRWWWCSPMSLDLSLMDVHGEECYVLELLVFLVFRYRYIYRYGYRLTTTGFA